MLTKNNLHNYQKATVDFIIEHRFCGVFLDLGLGKTISTLTAINELMYDYCEISSVLVIAPKRVAETVWAEEAAKWEHTKHLTISKIIGTERKRLDALKVKADIYVVSRDNVAWLCNVFASRLPFDMVVIDELSSFKSYQSQRFKSLRMSRPFMKRVVGLTGTPAPNSLIDLWPQMFLIDRGERLGKTITQYRARYFRPGKTNGYVVYSYDIVAGASEMIQEKISDICISMKADDYLDMPERTDNFIYVNMNSELKEKYNKFKEDSIIRLVDDFDNGGISEINAVNAAALVNKLLQFANGSVYDEDKNVHKIHALKLEALKEIVENSNGQPILVAWTYQFDRDAILEAFRAYNPRQLKTADDINDWNAGKIQIMLAHPASAGHGLNLQAGGSIIVWYGLTWSLELYQQFNARLYRQGQTEHVIIHHIVTKGTYDEEVIRAIKRKDKNQNRLLDSIKADIAAYCSSH